MRKPTVFGFWLILVWIGLGVTIPGQAPGGEIARYEYYPDGLTKTLTYANGVVSRYEYYANAWLRSLESRTTSGELVSRYEYDYDSNGNRTEMREWNGTPARRAADPMWAAAPSVTKYGYDRLDRLVWVEYRPVDAAAPYRRVEYTHDLAGNRLREVARELAPDGTALRTLKDRGFRYSRLNRLEAVTDALAPERGTRYLYDAAGHTVARITGVIGPDGWLVPGTEQSRLVFDWDAASRLRQVRQLTPAPDGGTTEELLAEFRYDYRGRRIAADSRFVALGSDTVPTETRLYVYDEEAVLAEYGFGPDGRTPYKSRQYLYGNELLAVELYAPPEAGKTTDDGRPATGLEPSSAYQPSTATGNLAPGGSVFPTRVPSTKPRGQLLPGSRDARMITEEDRFYGSSSHPADTAAYFPPPFPPPSVPSSRPPDSRLPSPVSRSAFNVQRSTFDVRPASSDTGLRSSVTGLLFYHLDALGSTVNLTAADGAVAEAYLYDAWGNYRELDVPAGSPGPPAPEPVLKATWPGAGSPGLPAGGPGLRAAADTLIIDPDLDENGLYCWATYLAYIQGAFSPSPESPVSSLADSNRLTYTGHEFDPATGLYYFKARFYDPEIGRFLSEDPYLGDAATPPSLHRFLYAYNNPLKYIDLTGYAAESQNPSGKQEAKIVAEKNPSVRDYRNQGKRIQYDSVVSNEALGNPNSRDGYDLQEMARIAKDPNAMEQVYYDAAHGNRKAQWLVTQYEGVATGLGAQIARELNSLESLVISKEVNPEKIPFSTETASGKKLLGLMATGYEKEARRLHFRNEVIGYTFMLLMAGGVAKSALSGEAALTSKTALPGPSKQAGNLKIPWGEGIGRQGYTWEEYLASKRPPSSRLPANFKTFDFFDEETGLATSGKTLNTRTPAKINDPKQIYFSLKSNIDAAAGFSGYQLGNTRLTPDMISSREVQIAIPADTTAAQWKEIQRAVQYGKGLGVNVVVTPVR